MWMIMTVISGGGKPKTNRKPKPKSKPQILLLQVLNDFRVSFPKTRVYFFSGMIEISIFYAEKNSILWKGTTILCFDKEEIRFYRLPLCLQKIQDSVQCLWAQLTGIGLIQSSRGQWQLVPWPHAPWEEAIPCRYFVSPLLNVSFLAVCHFWYCFW